MSILVGTHQVSQEKKEKNNARDFEKEKACSHKYLKKMKHLLLCPFQKMKCSLLQVFSFSQVFMLHNMKGGGGWSRSKIARLYLGPLFWVCPPPQGFTLNQNPNSLLGLDIYNALEATPKKSWYHTNISLCGQILPLGERKGEKKRSFFTLHKGFYFF